MKIVEKTKRKEVDFSKLKPGDCFKVFGELYVKSAYEQQATGLQTGEARFNMCGIKVTPVNAEIHVV